MDLLTQINSRVCLAPNCRRLVNSEAQNIACWWHTLLRSKLPNDPYLEDIENTGEWITLARPRMEQLEHIYAAKGVKRRLASQASRELKILRFLGALSMVPRTVEDWHEEAEHPKWRLPPAGWIYNRIADCAPDLHIQSVYWAPDISILPDLYRTPEALDALARHFHESAQPTKAPFWPITTPRSPDKTALSNLEAQEHNNLPTLIDYAASILDYKHDNNQGAAAKLLGVAGIDLDIPTGTVVFHQIVNPVEEEPSPRVRRSLHSFAQHQALTAGDHVRYNHIRASTVRAEWLSNLGLTWAEPVGLDDDDTETAIRLELAPRRGLYIGSSLCIMAKSHLSMEQEVVLPAGTIWEVVSVVDARHHLDWKYGEPVYRRLRTIQMRELGEQEVPPNGIVQSMTMSSEGHPRA